MFAIKCCNTFPRQGLRYTVGASDVCCSSRSIATKNRRGDAVQREQRKANKDPVPSDIGCDRHDTRSCVTTDGRPSLRNPNAPRACVVCVEQENPGHCASRGSPCANPPRRCPVERNLPPARCGVLCCIALRCTAVGGGGPGLPAVSLASVGSRENGLDLGKDRPLRVSVRPWGKRETAMGRSSDGNAACCAASARGPPALGSIYGVRVRTRVHDKDPGGVRGRRDPVRANPRVCGSGRPGRNERVLVAVERGGGRGKPKLPRCCC